MSRTAVVDNASRDRILAAMAPDEHLLDKLLIITALNAQISSAAQLALQLDDA